MKLPTPMKTDNPHAPVRFSPSRMAHTLSVECFSLSKSTSYLSLCLSLNSFCNETSRTWASLSPETRCVISVGRPWVWAGFESQPCGFRSQSEVHGFSPVCCFCSLPFPIRVFSFCSLVDGLDVALQTSEWRFSFGSHHFNLLSSGRLMISFS